MSKNKHNGSFWGAFIFNPSGCFSDKDRLQWDCDVKFPSMHTPFPGNCKLSCLLLFTMSSRFFCLNETQNVSSHLILKYHSSLALILEPCRCRWNSQALPPWFRSFQNELGASKLSLARNNFSKSLLWLFTGCVALFTYNFCPSFVLEH